LKYFIFGKLMTAKVRARQGLSPGKNCIALQIPNISFKFKLEVTPLVPEPTTHCVA
jgi:hypothetical protein